MLLNALSTCVYRGGNIRWTLSTGRAVLPFLLLTAAVSAGEVLEQKQTKSEHAYSAGARFGSLANGTATHQVRNDANEEEIFIDPPNPDDGTHWRHAGTIMEFRPADDPDSVTVQANIQHLDDPHAGEMAPNPNLLEYELQIVGVPGEVWLTDTERLVVAHEGVDVDTHRNGLYAALYGLSQENRIVKYGICLVGAHNPVPPPDEEEPEPGPPVPFGQVEFQADDELMESAGVVGALGLFTVEGAILHLALSGASLNVVSQAEVEKILEAKIIDPTDGDRIVVDFKDNVSVSAENDAFSAQVQAELSDDDVQKLLAETFYVVIRTDLGALSGQLNLARRPVPVPTTSEWGLIILALLAVAAGIFLIVRRRASLRAA